MESHMLGRCCCSEMMIIRNDWKKLKYCLMTCGLSCKDLFVCFVCLAASEQLVSYARAAAVGCVLWTVFWRSGLEV
jgi:hypothetical protein